MWSHLTQKVMKNLNTASFQTDDPIVVPKCIEVCSFSQTLDRKANRSNWLARILCKTKNCQTDEPRKISGYYFHRFECRSGGPMERSEKGEDFKLFPEDVALLMIDVENRQAIEMCSISSGNHQRNDGCFTPRSFPTTWNTVMKTLTVVTIALSIPMIVAGFFRDELSSCLLSQPADSGRVILSAVLALLVGSSSPYTNR
jgi:hypothetical protein